MPQRNRRSNNHPSLVTCPLPSPILYTISFLKIGLGHHFLQFCLSGNLEYVGVQLLTIGICKIFHIGSSPKHCIRFMETIFETCSFFSTSHFAYFGDFRVGGHKWTHNTIHTTIMEAIIRRQIIYVSLSIYTYMYTNINIFTYISYCY